MVKPGMVVKYKNQELIGKHLAPVVQRLDNAIQRMNRSPVDKCSQNKPRYPLDSDLSGG